MERMMTSPPESSRARLLKLRRVHVGFVRRNRDRALRRLLGSDCAPTKDSDVISIAILGEPSDCLHKTANKGNYSSTNYFGGVLASTHRWKCRRHVEDGSLASLKTGPKQINADNEGLAIT